MVERIFDLVFSEADGKPLLLDLYLPQGAERPFPLIIWLHGGGWKHGDRRLAPDLSRYFAERGLAMASIDYRLSDEATFPAQIHDVKAAIRWLRGNAAQFGFDGERIGLWGSSAGGHLAAIAALAGDGVLEADDWEANDVSAAVQAVVDGYGPTDFLQMDAQRQPLPPEKEDPESVRVPPDKRTADADSFESLLVGAPIEERPDLVQAASPLTYARPAAPPFLILHGLSDTAVPAQQSVLLYEVLIAHGNDVTLYLVEGLGHGFLNRNNFDQPPRLAQVWHGEKQAQRKNVPLTFDTIEQFFKEKLEGSKEI